ncbi:hypothetical protein NLJ89_g7196 [Agrocybe chaxingu]|uniref:Uncharacterized protein n=1 Tax=Agrocybe chaxingu TaxID=84603 RepID=A0A9W8MTC6_9AGAR|nr:hypothetical protein NLJ89_g7196 [Agrocybe chaxingu]
MSSPSPKPGRWSSRMGGALRRTSTLLSIARPGTPSRESGSDKDSDTTSLRRSTSRSSLSGPSTLAPPAPTPQPNAPSPIAESPAREALAVQQDIVGPSPLAKQTTAEPESIEAAVTASPEPAQAPARSETAEDTTSPERSPTSLRTFLNPKSLLTPFAASSTGPPTPPVEEAKAEVAPQPAVEEPAAQPQVIAAPALEQTSSYFDKPMAESMKSSESLVPASRVEFAEAVEQNTAIEAPAPKAEVQPTLPSAPATQAQAQEPDYEHGEAASYYRGDPSMPIAEPHRVAEPEHEAEHEQQRAKPEVVQQPIHAPAPVQLSTAVMPSYDLPEYSHQEIWGGASHGQVPKPHDVWSAPSQVPSQEAYRGPLPIPIPIPITTGAASGAGNGHASYHGESSIGMPNPHPEPAYNDPFADPVAPIIAITHSDAPHMPHPEVSQRHQQAPTETHNDAQGIIVMPLPPMNEVVHKQPVHRVPSHSSLGGSRINLETDETLPLLSRQAGKSNYLNTSTQGHKHGASSTHHVLISPLAPSPSSWTTYGNSHPRLHELGWLEYHLPDGTVYYVHPTRRITTDINLRSERLLDAVSSWLDERRDESPNVGVECWLKEVKDPKKASKSGWGRKSGNSEAPVVLERYLVDHHVRTVVKDDEEERSLVGFGRNHAYSNGHGGHGKGKKQAVPKVEEDQLDLEYRYWSFMEAHPAHTALPHKARTEAVDVLNWAWTDRLLPSHRGIPAPFSQEECQELINILRSFSNDSQQEDHGIQTRIVARILLRVAQWRQTYFRPNKPLPKDVGTPIGALPVQRRPFRRAIFDLLISCLCLGIPYLFIERARLSLRGADHESGLRHSSPMVIIGACTCLVAAIVLSASVTFLSLPGLDSVARTAGMVAILFAAGAIAATGVAVLRHKADLERPASRVGVEGIMIVTRRTMALSLPTVFLAYSLIAFVTGLVLYVYRGVSFTNPSLPRNSFEDYTRWTVVGLVGALAGMLTTTMLLFRG